MTSTRRNSGVEQHTRLLMTTYYLRRADESNGMMSLSVDLNIDCMDEAQQATSRSGWLRCKTRRSRLVSGQLAAETFPILLSAIWVCNCDPLFCLRHYRPSVRRSRNHRYNPSDTEKYRTSATYVRVRDISVVGMVDSTPADDRIPSRFGGHLSGKVRSDEICASQ